MGDEDAVAEQRGEAVVAGRLGALVPGQRHACGDGEVPQGLGETRVELVRAVAVGQRDEPDETGAAVHERGDGGAVPPPGDQVAFPVAGALPVLDDGGPFVDECRRHGESRSALVGLAALLAQRPAGAELLRECPAQDAFRALVEGTVDGLVAQLSFGSVRPQSAQVGGDLLRAPLKVESVLDLSAELGVEPQLRSSRPFAPLSGAVVGEVGVVEALVVFEHVAA